MVDTQFSDGKNPPHISTNILGKQLPHDPVNSPSHYKFGGIDPIDYMQIKMTPEQFKGFLIGNVLKYVSRYPHKNGVEDLKKAKWYLDRLINSESE